MSSLLDRLSAVEASVKAEDSKSVSEEKEEAVLEPDTGSLETDWLTNSTIGCNKNDQKKLLDTIENPVKPVPLENLVWVRHVSIKDGWLPARIVDYAEAAIDKHIKLVGDDEVVVEWFGAPKDHRDFWRFETKKKKDVRPFAEAPVKKASS